MQSSYKNSIITVPGEAYEKLNETYVIFITENDVIGDELPIYHIERIVKETGKLFGDEEHIIYVNSQIQDKTELGRLMHDFYCVDAKEMHNKPLADRVRYFKEDEKGVAVMCREMEQMRNETSAKERQEITLRLAKMGMPPEQIAQAVKEPVAVIKNWILNVGN